MDANYQKIIECRNIVNAKQADFERKWESLDNEKEVVMRDLTVLAEAVEFLYDLTRTREQAKIRLTDVRQTHVDSHVEICQKLSSKVAELFSKMTGSLKEFAPLGDEVRPVFLTIFTCLSDF